MAKRTHFTDNDIDVFLNDENWQKTFNKRIVDWKVARFPYDQTFIQKLFNQVASNQQNEGLYTELLNKLDAAGYPFSESEFLPGTMHIGSWDDHFTDTYIQLFSFIESKGCKLTKKFRLKMFEMFKETFNPKLVIFLKCKGIDTYWSNIEKLVHGLRMKATSNFIDLGGVSRNALGKLFLNQAAQSSNQQLNKRFLDALKESGIQENIELQFIIDYLNNNVLTASQISTLESLLVPPQIRLQQKLLAANGSVNPLEMIQLGTQKKAKPRDWFNDSQLKIIDLIQPKYGLMIVQ